MSDFHNVKECTAWLAISDVTSERYHVMVWSEFFLPLSFFVNYLNCVQTDFATNNECISDIHDTIQIELAHIFVNHWNANALQISIENTKGIYQRIP